MPLKRGSEDGVAVKKSDTTFCAVPLALRTNGIDVVLHGTRYIDAMFNPQP
jgi:hypothetical protein